LNGLRIKIMGGPTRHLPSRKIREKVFRPFKVQYANHQKKQTRLRWRAFATRAALINFFNPSCTISYENSNYIPLKISHKIKRWVNGLQMKIMGGPTRHLPSSKIREKVFRPFKVQYANHQKKQTRPQAN
jgi:hypothetical protein